MKTKPLTFLLLSTLLHKIFLSDNPYIY